MAAAAAAAAPVHHCTYDNNTTNLQFRQGPRSVIINMLYVIHVTLYYYCCCCSFVVALQIVAPTNPATCRCRCASRYNSARNSSGIYDYTHCCSTVVIILCTVPAAVQLCKSRFTSARDEQPRGGASGARMRFTALSRFLFFYIVLFIVPFYVSLLFFFFLIPRVYKTIIYYFD